LYMINLFTHNMTIGMPHMNASLKKAIDRSCQQQGW
jgi:hypothetical protein